MSRGLIFHVFGIVLCSVHLFWLLQRSQAQTTEPSEARALNTIFQRWGIFASDKWNISGELCTGRATDSTSIDNDNYNPGIKCDCPIDNQSTCHITKLKVYALGVSGAIPEELQNLTFLSNLNLARNNLSGPLPRFIGNLTSMQYITVGINALSGELPKELGNLSELMSLAFGSNNFSGSLPSELGRLSKLEQIYFDSSGVSGKIPPSFSNLQNLKTVWASDTQLIGRIPDFIGNWIKLTSLRFQGNSLNGPIPSTFSNLALLNDLRISELSNGSSSLAFTMNMKYLKTLILRNNNISGTIPSNIGDYLSLEHLDLSFNNLIGRPPESLFNLSSLIYLFLGNNRLSGNLPPQKSSSLHNLDLSYNGFSGSLPSWVTEQNLQLNLVANNFTIDSSNNRNFPGLNCLQQNFPCNRDPPLYSSFAIKCGGPKITSSNGIQFDRDNATLGPASYFVNDGNRWAVSNVGRFGESIDAEYTRSHQSQFPNSLDSVLFQTARISPGSLRYYGLGLENGNYTVLLQFSETDFPDSTWESHGRRLFDIYLQGKLEERDFDIRKEAGGSFRAAQKEFKVQVSKNFLEIHLFWAGKGTCCIPVRGTYGPSISAISATPDFIPTVGKTPPKTTKKKKRTGVIVGVIVTLGVISFLFVFVVLALIRRRKRRGADEHEDLLEISSRPNTFSYEELRSATEDFIRTNKLGEGGFGPVYKGKLADGRNVAVKLLSVSSHQGKSQFITEIDTISAVQHRNLVKLYGCCIEGDNMLLVYEYLENKSLDQALWGKSGLHLDWPTRYEICLGTARGLAYLHEESRLRIVHRDVKASNILLDTDLNPKISDFGLAKLYDEKKTHISTRVAGTIGYLAPEYAMRGHLTEKADVFGFGVVALEVLSGRPNSDTSLDDGKVYLLEWAWNLHEENRELELVDQTLSKFNEEEAKRVIGVSLLCTQMSPLLRPPMSRVVAMLSGDIQVPTVTSKPGYITDWQFKDLTTTSSQHGSPSTSPMVVGEYTPINASTQPMLSDIITDGR